MLIDTHCHFDFPPINLPECWQQAQAAGVARLVIPGFDLQQWTNAAQWASDYPSMAFGIGVHPWRVEICDAEQALRQAASWLTHPRCVAIGETGLDATIDTPIPLQLEALKQHILLANQWQLPVILHCVKAHNELIRALKACPIQFGGVVHAFSGSYELASTYWEMGLHLGIGGTITYPRARKTQGALKRAPLESLVLETDAPNMPLYGRQGQPNEPKFLVEIAQSLAELRGMSLDEVSATTSQNAHRLFSNL